MVPTTANDLGKGGVGMGWDSWAEVMVTNHLCKLFFGASEVDAVWIINCRREPGVDLFLAFASQGLSFLGFAAMFLFHNIFHFTEWDLSSGDFPQYTRSGVHICGQTKGFVADNLWS